MKDSNKLKSTYRRKLRIIQKRALNNGLQVELLKRYNYVLEYQNAEVKTFRRLTAAVVTVLIIVLLSISLRERVISARCLLPSNYFVWEATRPLADCSYCANVTKPIILRNITRKQFTVSPITNFT